MITPKPLYQYGGTITFAPHRDFNNKSAIINIFHNITFDTIQRNIPNETWGSIQLALQFTIEYHKVENKDDYEAPHIHFILSTPRKLSKDIFNILLDRYKTIGRSQLYLLTSSRFNTYSQYIYKDTAQLEQLLHKPHHFQFNYTLTYDTSPPEILEDE